MKPVASHANAKVSEIIQKLQEDSPAVHHAREETNHQFRHSEVSVRGTGKKKANSNSKKSHTKVERSVKIQSIIVLPCGAANIGSDRPVPRATELRELRECGLGIRDAVKGLEFFRSWGVLWLLTIDDEDEDDEILTHRLPYRLLSRSQGILELIDVSHPKGTDYHEFKGHPMTSVADSHIYIVTRKPIPEDIYKSWKFVQETTADSTDTSDEGDSNAFSATASNARHPRVVKPKGKGKAVVQDLGKRPFPEELKDTATDEEIECGLSLMIKVPKKTAVDHVHSLAAGPSHSIQHESANGLPASTGARMDIDLSITDSEDDKAVTPAREATTPSPQPPMANVASSPDFFRYLRDPWTDVDPNYLEF
ncbi:hypothetical protein A0H81_04733 [Grifola frondosa]|uniref:Uncharacterized protein n=1 Tax=Grifola frondosa TaxID=5627 RepID=A0A1C7MGL7_GRIFR|nr:hypothetical protein A0H81_04733 [Grifola frondosa]